MKIFSFKVGQFAPPALQACNAEISCAFFASSMCDYAACEARPDSDQILFTYPAFCDQNHLANESSLDDSRNLRFPLIDTKTERVRASSDNRFICV